MSDRKQFILVNGEKSDEVPLIFGVPQGSNFGPTAFKRYDRPAGIICQNHGIQYHIFADDTQIYIFLNPKDDLSLTNAILEIQACISNIKQWMASQFLKLNWIKLKYC